MPSRKSPKEKVYPTYQPYPVSWGSDHETYKPPSTEQPRTSSPQHTNTDPFDDFPDLIGDPAPPDWLRPQPITSKEEPSLRPLRLLQSLFADRLDFLQAALRELQDAGQEREQLTAAALEDIDSHIKDCDIALTIPKGNTALNDLDRRKQLERQLLELKRQRRQEAVMSWRDLLSLKREIHALKREIDSLGRTANSTENREAPT